MAAALIVEFAAQGHKSLVDAGVKVDFVFAYPSEDAGGVVKGAALRLGGYPCLGIARILGLKDRAMGRGDAEISLDGNWWASATVPEQRALLDHELHHLTVKEGKHGYERDDLHRPRLKMRKHDYDFGWFTEIARRHGAASAECNQAGLIMKQSGPVLFQPELLLRVEEALAATDKADGIKASPAKRVDRENVEFDEDEIAQCIEIIRTEQKASISLLQRRLRLRYIRASSIMDELEGRGIVGPSKGSEPRDILIAVEVTA